MARVVAAVWYTSHKLEGSVDGGKTLSRTYSGVLGSSSEYGGLMLQSIWGKKGVDIYGVLSCGKRVEGAIQPIIPD